MGGDQVIQRQQCEPLPRVPAVETIAIVGQQKGQIFARVWEVQFYWGGEIAQQRWNRRLCHIGEDEGLLIVGQVNDRVLTQLFTFKRQSKILTGLCAH